jgi:1-acyl-sn-glycerol-3-phosphate acyltransferase
VTAAALRSAVFAVLGLAWSVLVVLAFLPAMALPRQRRQGLARLWCRGLLALLRVICGLGWRLEGAENVPRGAAIVASKHQSAWDTLIFHILLNDPVYILKKELITVPGLGWSLKTTGNIAIDRKAGAGALRPMLAAVGARLDEGAQLIIFPEGTRAAPGSALPYQPGVAALYGRFDVPMVPVAVNSGLFWGRRSFLKRPGTITIRFLPPLPGGLNRRDALAALHTAIETATDTLCRSVPPGHRGAKCG